MEDQLDDENVLLGSTKVLKKENHIKCLQHSLKNQLPSFLSTSQTWISYWVTHSLRLLKQDCFIDTVIEEVITFINDCKDKNGGYGGGPGQIAHVATTYAAVNALISLQSVEALETIDRNLMVDFLRKMKQPNGSFRMHDDGEIDSRSVYCALSILKCLNIHDTTLLENVADWLMSCQTYEGGFSSFPGCEAHGGYTFCCIASLCLLNQMHRVDMHSLLSWLSNRQMDIGGFNGRTNKLVDSCYSFWQGAIFLLIQPYLLKENATELNDFIEREWFFDNKALQRYILNCCQSSVGLLRDKPGADADLYHTCYALSGLSISQHQPNGSITDSTGSTSENTSELETLHPVFNLTFGSLAHCQDFFKTRRMVVMKKEQMY